MFFDNTRMRGTLRLLPQLSDAITRYWIVAQRFPRDEFLALEIPCGNHPDARVLRFTLFCGYESRGTLSSLTLGAVDIYLSVGDCEEFFVLTRRGEEE